MGGAVIEYITRTEINDRERQVRREIDAVRAVSERHAGELAALVAKVDARADSAWQVIAALRMDLYGDPSKRAGPVSLFERLDQMERRFDAGLRELQASIQAHDAQIRRWAGLERLVLSSVRVLLHLPVLRWIGGALRWLLVIAAGLGLGAALSSVLMAWWR